MGDVQANSDYNMECGPVTRGETYSEPCTSNSSSTQHVVAHVYGVLVARSHILKCKPPLFFMSLSGHKYPILILVNTVQAESWMSSLNMHSTYKFSHLLRRSKTFEDPHEIVNYFNTTECSQYIELDAIQPCINPWVQTNRKLINYQGIVTSSISPLGLVLLDNKLNLCLFFVWTSINLSGIHHGQEVKICNAHLSKSNDMLVMCCRSSLHVLKEDPHQSQVDPPLPRIVGDLTFGYGDYRWLQKQLCVLEKKFCDDFLLSELLNISTAIKSCEEIRINTLATFLGLLSPHTSNNILNSDRLMRDFFTVEHKCILYRQPESSRPFISLLKEQFTSLNALLENTVSSPLAQQMPYWRWFTHNVVTGNDLLGYLSVSEVDTYWHLSDSSCTYTCLIDKQPKADLQGQIVYIRQYKVVMEKFMLLGAGNNEETSKFYLFIPHDSIIPLTNTCISFPLECNVPAIQQVAVCCTLCSNARRHIQDELTFSACSEEWKKSDVINPSAARVYSHTKHIHVVAVHYIATPTKLQGVVYCFILVSVLQSSSHHADAGAFPCILVLQGRLLQALPFLEVGVAFYLHIPFGRDVKTFAQAKLNIQLPWSVIQLPEETALSRHLCAHSGSWWTLRDHASKGMCCIEGVVESRKHLPPKFDSEFASINTQGYGEPNLRTIVIVMRDEEICHTLYLNHWNKRCYPLGLVPGARICATLVKQATSSSSNEYFQATDLTAINILDLSDSIKQTSLDDTWSCACDITLANDKELENVVCGSVNSWTILSVVITAVCGGCKLLRLNGPCEFPGCLARDDSVTFIANARIIINGMGGKKILHLKDNNVREMLNFTPSDWDILLSLSMKHELKFKKHHDFVQRQFHSDAENIFQLYCLNHALTNRCIYVRCKGFKKNDDMDGKNCSRFMKFQSIFCLELVNKSPWPEPHSKIK